MSQQHEGLLLYFVQLEPVLQTVLFFTKTTAIHSFEHGLHTYCSA